MSSYFSANIDLINLITLIKNCKIDSPNKNALSVHIQHSPLLFKQHLQKNSFKDQIPRTHFPLKRLNYFLVFHQTYSIQELPSSIYSCQQSCTFVQCRKRFQSFASNLITLIFSIQKNGNWCGTHVTLHFLKNTKTFAQVFPAMGQKQTVM